MPDVATPSPTMNYTCSSCKIVFWINKGLELYPFLSSVNRILGRMEMDRFVCQHVSVRLCLHPQTWTVPKERGGGHAPSCFCAPSWVRSWNRKLWHGSQLLQSDIAISPVRGAGKGLVLLWAGDIQRAVLAAGKGGSWWEVAASWPSPFWEILAHANIRVL